MHLRRVADAGIGAALRSDVKLERQLARGIALDRQADGDILEEDLDLAEVFVVLLLAPGENRRAERDAVAIDSEAELVAVKVVALGDIEDDLDRLPVQRPGAGLEGDGRVEEFLGVNQRRQEGKEEEQSPHHGRWSVSATTQFRYSGRPWVTGRAMISGTL